jgi:hypothetical protein
MGGHRPAVERTLVLSPFLFRTSPPLTPRPKSWAICARLQTAANEALEGEIRVGDSG